MEIITVLIFEKIVLGSFCPYSFSCVIKVKLISPYIDELTKEEKTKHTETTTACKDL